MFYHFTIVYIEKENFIPFSLYMGFFWINDMKAIGGQFFSRNSVVFFTILLTLGMVSTIIPTENTKAIVESKTRGVEGWVDVTEESGSFFIDSSHDMIISYDDERDSITFGESYDPYYDLDPKIREAVDKAPQWLNDTLVWSFINLYSQYRMDYAEVLLNESILRGNLRLLNTNCASFQARVYYLKASSLATA